MFRRGYTGPPVQVRNLPESADRPQASADPPPAQRPPRRDIMRFVPVPTNLVAAATAPSTVSLPPCSRFPTVATYSPNRRTTETRHMNRTRPSGIRLCERHTRNAPPVPFRAEAGATRAPQDAIPYMTLHAKPTSVLPTSIAVSTAVQYGQPLTGNYSIEITTAKAALAERLLTILVSAA